MSLQHLQVLLKRVKEMLYEQDDTYMGQSFEEAEPALDTRIGKWQVAHFVQFVNENFEPLDKQLNLSLLQHSAA